MLTTLLLHPLGPALLLALGGFSLRLGGKWLRPLRPVVPAARLARPVLPDSSFGRLTYLFARLPFALVFVGTAAVLLLLLRSQSAGAVLRWNWQPLAVAGSELVWRLDGWSWLVSLLILILTTTSLVLRVQTEPATPADAGHTLLLAAAALVFVTSDNVVTLAMSWIVLDAALVLKLRPGERVQSAARAWGMLSLASALPLAVVLLLGEAGIRTLLGRGPFDALELALLWLAALVRAGVYPLHYWLTDRRSLEAGDRIAVHLIAPITGLWLLARVHQVAGPDWLRGAEWAALGALGLLGSALAAWSAEEQERAWRWIAINRASLVVLAAHVAELAGPPALVWSLITFALGMALLATGECARSRWGWQWPLWLGALTVWGLPGTPGLLARSALVLPMGVPAALMLFAIIVVAETLLVAVLWEFASASPASEAVRPRRPSSFQRTAAARSLGFVELGAVVVILAVPTVAWGLVPQQVRGLLGLAAPGGSSNVFQVMLQAPASVWAALILSGAAGVALGRYGKEVFAGMRGWQQGINALVSLDWLYKAFVFGFIVTGRGLQYLAQIGEGEGYVGWLVLAALVLLVLLRG